MARARHASAKKAPANDEQDEERTGAGPGRGIWSGSISFGLLQIPVTLFTAESRREEIHFRQLDKDSLAPIKYERVSSQTGKPVAWNDIVKGYEIEKGEYVVLEPEDLAKANVRATQSLDIQDFVPMADIDPAFFETPYYIVPQKRATKAYVLLRDALRHKKAAAIATFVLRTREHLCALMPVGDAIMLETLRFGHELKDAGDMPLPTKHDSGLVGDREQQMAEQLVEGMMTEWNPRKYKDRYYADVMAMIEEKARTGTAKKKHTAMPGKVATDVVDLLDLLKKSVAGASKGSSANDTTAHPKRGVAKAKKRTARSKGRAA
jgi:DNA end-binding protein Ku